MTTAELHEILDDENRKLTADELKEVVYQLKQDCWGEYYKESDKANANNIKLITYSAEANAFQICLDLLEHSFTGFYADAVRRDVTHWMPLPEAPKTKGGAE